MLSPSSKKRLTLVFLIVLIIAVSFSAVLIVRAAGQDDEPARNMILDTDLGPWSDDYGAVKILAHYAKNEQLNLLAVMSNNVYNGAVPMIDAVLHYHGFKDVQNRTQIPIGISHDPKAYNSTGKLGIPEKLLGMFPHPSYSSNHDAVDAVELYRETLASQPDNSVDILSIGYFTNLANLLDTPADEKSNLTGLDLVSAKVRKVIVMAGEYPRGHETNIVGEPSSAKKFFEDWPTPMIIVGFEIGKVVQCGTQLLDPVTHQAVKKSPLSISFEVSYAHYNKTDSCFDESATMAFVEPYEEMFDVEYGHNEVFLNGTNVWHPSAEQTKQGRLILKVTNTTLVDRIDKIFME